MLQPRFSSYLLLRRLHLAISSSSSSSSSRRFVVASQQRRYFSAEKPSSGSGNSVSLTFVEADGVKKTISVQEGVTLLEAAHANDVPVEGKPNPSRGFEGACDGQCACSTCHVILSERLYESLPEPSVEEDDMLDLAACLTDTSRLGCQVRVNKNFEGEQIRLPPITPREGFAVTCGGARQLAADQLDAVQ
ncbi:hypothetical protein ACSSS7_008022 [Eimeria intestinalis]